jgi:hypothetical protein
LTVDEYWRDADRLMPSVPVACSPADRLCAYPDVEVRLQTPADIVTQLEYVGAVTVWVYVPPVWYRA